MHKLKYLTILIILVMALSLADPSFVVSARPLAAISPTLGAAASYSVLGGSIVTNTGATTMPGDLGISPSIGVPPHYTGFPPGIVGPPGTIHDADANAAAAQASNTAAFTSLDQGCDTTYAGVQDLTLVSPLGPGVYCAGAFILTGNLTLSGSGVWIFKSAATLTTSANSSVTGGDPCNVWWRLVSSGTLAPGTTFIGNILALTSISLQTGASLNGRALAQTGQVTLDANTITGSSCLAPPVATATATQPVPTSTATATQPGATSTATATQPGGATSTATATQQPGATATATTPGATPTNRPPTNTPLPVVTSLPGTGGGPIRNEDFPWSLVILGGFSAIALGLGIRAYRSTYQRKQ
jgi:hypothetical protein